MFREDKYDYMYMYWQDIMQWLLMSHLMFTCLHVSWGQVSLPVLAGHYAVVTTVSLNVYRFACFVRTSITTCTGRTLCSGYYCHIECLQVCMFRGDKYDYMHWQDIMQWLLQSHLMFTCLHVSWEQVWLHVPQLTGHYAVVTTVSFNVYRFACFVRTSTTTCTGRTLCSPALFPAVSSSWATPLLYISCVQRAGGENSPWTSAPKMTRWTK